MKKYLVLCLCLIPGYTSAGEYPITRMPYLTWQSDSSTTMTINWGTEEAMRGRVEYGLTPRYGHKVREAEKRMNHHIELTGLEAGRLYYYRIDRGFESSFRTAPSGEEDFSFCLVGHTGGSHTDDRYPPQPLIWRIRDMEPLFIVHAGDVVFYARTEESFDGEFFSLFSPVSSRVPIMISPSNHDAGWPYESRTGLDYSVFGELFPYPDGGPEEGNGIWYTFCVAGARFIALAYASPLEEGSEQREWLRNVLERSKADFNIVYLGGGQKLFNIFDIDELFRFLASYDVDLVLGGDGGNVWQETREGIPYVFCGSRGKRPPPFVYFEYRKNCIFLYAMDSSGEVLFTRKVEKKTGRRLLFSLSEFSDARTSPGLAFVGGNRFTAKGGNPYFDVGGLNIDLRGGICVECTVTSPKRGYLSFYWSLDEKGPMLCRSSPILWVDDKGPHTYRYYLPRTDPLGGGRTILRRLRVRFSDFPGGEGEITSLKIYSNPFRPACAE